MKGRSCRGRLTRGNNIIIQRDTLVCSFNPPWYRGNKVQKGEEWMGGRVGVSAINKIVIKYFPTKVEERDKSPT